jgi:hypothetical protein
MVNCDYNNYGCTGGYLVNAIDFILTEGVTTADCVPYVDKDSTCSYKCTNKSAEYKKYYCKPGTLRIATSH